MRRLILLAVAVLVVLLAGGGALRLGDDPQPQGVERDAGRAQVIRVVDGDTILVRIDGRREPDGLFVNEELVRGGFATTLEVRPNLRYAGDFRDLEREARAQGRGLWGACDR